MRSETVPPRSPSVGRLFVVLPIAIAFLAMMNLQVPYVLLLPGPLEDTKSLVTVDGVSADPEEGKLYLTTVSLGPTRGRLLVVDYLRAKLDPHTDIVPAHYLYPPEVPREEVERRHRYDIEGSKLTAKAAALGRLGHDLLAAGAGAVVEEVVAGLPAESLLRPGDRIVSVDERSVCTPEQVVVGVISRPVGSELEIRFVRDGRTQSVAVPSGADAQNPRLPVIGVKVGLAEVTLPMDIEIDSRDIGGPSAGLMFALAITDLLDPADLTGGRDVAGTGTIDCDGRVGEVGGIVQKVASAEKESADMFLVPLGELQEACRVARDMQVVGVSNLDEAVQVLADRGAARSRSCPMLAAR